MPDLWNKGFHFGDWLFYRPFDDNDGRAAVTDKYMIAQCFYAHSLQLLIQAANVLEKKEDVVRNRLVGDIVTAYGHWDENISKSTFPIRSGKGDR